MLLVRYKKIWNEFFLVLNKIINDIDFGTVILSNEDTI